MGRPLETQPAREPLAGPVDIHHRFRLQAPRLDEIIEPQHPIHDQDRILDDDVAVLLEGLLEQADFQARAAIVENEGDAVRAAADLEHQPGDGRRLSLAPSALAQGRRGPRAPHIHQASADQKLQIGLVGADRMTAQEQPEGLALAGKPLRIAPIGHCRILGRGEPEQIHLTDAHRTRVLFPEVHGALELGGERCAIRAQMIETPGLDQRLEHPLVHPLQIDAPAKIRQASIRTMGGALVDDGLHRRFAHALDGAQAEADAGGSGDLKRVLRFVHVRRMNGELHADAFVDERDDLVGLVHVRRQHRRHERRGVVCLEPGRLVGQERVRGRVRFVETVAREFFHQIEDHRGLRLTHAARHRAAHEYRTLLGHLLRFLFPHRASQQVGAAQRVAREDLRDLHDLLLVQDHAVGRGEHGLQVGVKIIDGRAGGIVLAGDEIVDHARLQRSRPEQGDQRDDVAEAVRLQTPDEILHAA